jgi:hypothetical protein
VTPAPASPRSLGGILAHKDAVIGQLEAALASSRRQVALLRSALEDGTSQQVPKGAHAAALEALQESRHKADAYRSQFEAVRRDYQRLLALCDLCINCTEPQ